MKWLKIETKLKSLADAKLVAAKLMQIRVVEYQRAVAPTDVK